MAVTQTYPDLSEGDQVRVLLSPIITVGLPVKAGSTIKAGYGVSDDTQTWRISTDTDTKTLVAMSDYVNASAAAAGFVTAVRFGRVRIAAGAAIAKDDYIVPDVTGYFKPGAFDPTNAGTLLASMKKLCGRAVDACGAKDDIIRADWGMI